MTFSRHLVASKIIIMIFIHHGVSNFYKINEFSQSKFKSSIIFYAKTGLGIKKTLYRIKREKRSFQKRSIGRVFTPSRKISHPILMPKLFKPRALIFEKLRNFILSNKDTVDYLPYGSNGGFFIKQGLNYNNVRIWLGNGILFICKA